MKLTEQEIVYVAQLVKFNIISDFEWGGYTEERKELLDKLSIFIEENEKTIEDLPTRFEDNFAQRILTHYAVDKE